MKNDKILQEKILSDVELDNVAGGTQKETNQDLKNFEAMGMKIFFQSNDKSFMYYQTLENLINAFNKFGVKYEYDFGDKANKYFVGDKELNHEEVWKYINSKK